jgi:hypothetical protein
MGLAIHNFEEYLKSQNKRNIRQILSYAQRYHNILETGDATPLVLTKSSTTRRHAMESLAVYSKYLGCYGRWQQIRQAYSLKWTNGDESIQSLQRFFDSNLTLDSMLERVKEMIRVLPAAMAAIVKFNLWTGLRPVEACESVRLLNWHLVANSDKSFTGKQFDKSLSGQQYYNQEQRCLEHFRFPDIFLRPTKKAYISYLSLDSYQRIATLGAKPPTWTAIRSACKRRKIEMSMHLTRKIFASWLRQKGIEPEVVDLLQGRVSQSVLTRHYLAPDNRLRERVLNAVSELQQQIENI